VFVCSGVLGFTNANESTFINEFDKLPIHNPNELVDRHEFWIINENPFGDQVEELDEYRIAFRSSGEITLTRNSLSNTALQCIAHADANLIFFPFLFLNGSVSAVSIIGVISPWREASQKIIDESSECKICCDRQADCVLIPCGHIFFCMHCKTVYEQNSRKICPKCRSIYTDGLCIEEN
jgi:hypothetical protein